MNSSAEDVGYTHAKFVECFLKQLVLSYILIRFFVNLIEEKKNISNEEISISNCRDMGFHFYLYLSVSSGDRLHLSSKGDSTPHHHTSTTKSLSEQQVHLLPLHELQTSEQTASMKKDNHGRCLMRAQIHCFQFK